MERRGEEERLLIARIEDLADRAAGGELSFTDFLSPREIFMAEVELRRRGVSYRTFGGSPDAERRCVYFLPDYMEGEEELPLLLENYGMETGISALQIRGSGYRTLTHRDFLGSILALGLQRSVIGDIFVDGEGREATVFCREAMAEFLSTALETVGNDKVKVRILKSSEIDLPKRRYAALTDTVASERLDCVVAALCGCSRERARETVVSGLAELNYESEDRPDRPVSEGALISVKGVGKFRIVGLSDRTKKGRLRLTAEKFL